MLPQRLVGLRGGILLRAQLVQQPEGLGAAGPLLLRGKGDNWRIIDIYLNGTISQLATWRSEYGAAFQQQGFDGLMAAVEAQTSKDMRAF